ncbi:hypothetical protein, partial [Salmonella sp. s60732]|uniref:hypothetical protein n=1 Tax=Salmonella sp. s60732 TaxID=3160132 RepID=UPI0037540291
RRVEGEGRPEALGVGAAQQVAAPVEVLGDGRAVREGLDYLTLAARGNEVRGFVYDQTQRPKLIFAYFEGQSRQALERQACPAK